MKLFSKLRERLAADHEAIKYSKALAEEVDRTEPEVQELHKVALTKLRDSTEQARQLQAADRRNHYSESLAIAYRGKAAQ